jgi:hypothetical protein
MNQQNHSSDIFDTFWNNAGLRGELWNPSNYPLGLTKEIAKEDFENWVDTKNTILFDFIKVK